MSDLSDKWGLRQYKDGTLLHVRVQPNASKNHLEKDVNGALRLKITAAPVNDAANSVCIKYLASFFDVPKSKIEITRGMHSKEKWIWFKSIDPSFLNRILTEKALP